MYDVAIQAAIEIKLFLEKQQDIKDVTASFGGDVTRKKSFRKVGWKEKCAK